MGGIPPWPAFEKTLSLTANRTLRVVGPLHEPGTDGGEDSREIIIFASVMAVIDLPYIAIATGAAVIAAPILWFFGGLKVYQKERLLILFDPNRDPSGAG